MQPFEVLIPLTAVLTLFLGMPWLFLHYMTKWKQAKTLTVEDENLLDELHDIARRLDDRMTSIERIMAADRGETPRIADRIPELRSVNPSPQLHSRDQVL